MYNVRESWTDERLDDFRGEVNRRFDVVDREFSKVDKRFDKVDHELGRINDRLDGMYRASYVIGGGIIVALVGIVVQLH